MSIKTFAKILEQNESKKQKRARVNTTIYLSQDSIDKADFIAKHSNARSGTEVISDVLSTTMLDFINTFRMSIPSDKRDSFDNELADVLSMKEFSRIFKITPENIYDLADIIILDSPEENNYSTISGKIVRHDELSFTIEYLDSRGNAQEKVMLKENMDWEETEYRDSEDSPKCYIRFIKLRPIKDNDSIFAALGDDSCFCIDGYYCETWLSDYSDLGSDVSQINAPFKQEDIPGFQRNDNTITIIPSYLELTHIEGNQYETKGHKVELFDSCLLQIN